MKWEKNGRSEKRKADRDEKGAEADFIDYIDLAYWNLQEILRRVFRCYALVIFFVCNFSKLNKETACMENNVSILHAVGGRQSGEAMRFHEAAHSRGSSYIFEYEPQRDEQASTSRRFTRGVFIRDAKIFASCCGEEAFFMRV